MTSPLRRRRLPAWLAIPILLHTGCASRATSLSDGFRPPVLGQVPLPASVLVQFIPEAEGATCGSTYPRFVQYLKEQRMFSQVVSGTPETAGHYDVLMTAQFGCHREYHDAWNMALVVFEAATLLLGTLWPLHDYDVMVQARLGLFRDGKRLDQFEASSHFDVDARFFDVVHGKVRLDDVLLRAEDELHRKLAALLQARRQVFEPQGAGA